MTGKTTIRVDADLRELVPGFLQNRKTDIDEMDRALKAGDFDSIVMIGHKMKGTSAGYGFDQLGEWGGQIENAARAKQENVIRTCMNQILVHLAAVEIVFVEEP